MKAIVYDRYGASDVLALRDIDRPAVPEDAVLVRVRTAAANPLDWHYMRGEPYIVRLQSGLRGRSGTCWVTTWPARWRPSATQ